MQALEAAAQNLFFAPIFSVYIYLSITITTTWRTLHDIPWMQRGECVHARLCRCQDTIERLQKEVQLERRNCEDRLNPLRDTLIECNIECETLQTRTRVLERERDNFRYIAERPTANNTTSSWGYAPAQPDFSVALDEARSRIGRLLVEADNERAVKLADIASYKDTINKLSAQVRYSAGAGQDRSQTRTELEHAKSTIRSLERSLKDINSQHPNCDKPWPKRRRLTPRSVKTRRFVPDKSFNCKSSATSLNIISTKMIFSLATQPK